MRLLALIITGLIGYLTAPCDAGALTPGDLAFADPVPALASDGGQ